MKHGIVIRNKKTKNIVRFMECPTGMTALRILLGVRHNLGNDYTADEDCVEESELTPDMLS